MADVQKESAWRNFMSSRKAKRKISVPDRDLYPVILKASNEGLDPLVKYIANASTELLTLSEEYKRHSPDHSKYPDLIEREIRNFGGNSFINLARGSGPPYRKIALDVATRLGAKCGKDAAAQAAEAEILCMLLQNTYEKMTNEEKNIFLEEMGISDKGMTTALNMGAKEILKVAGGLLALKFAAMAANAVSRMVLGRGVTLAAESFLGRSLAVLSGPIGWTIGSLWTVFDLAGPAFRVTIPSVIHIAMLRQEQNISGAQG